MDDGGKPEGLRFAPDWRSARDYDFVSTLSPERLAWEFLRRNPVYRAAAADAGSACDFDAASWGLLRLQRC